MDEHKLIELWTSARNQVIVSQLAPTFLLITTVGLVPAISASGPWVVWATLGILLASGILGALIQFSAAHQAQATARDLAALAVRSSTAESVVALAPWLTVVKFVTPAIFSVIFIALAVSLLGG